MNNLVEIRDNQIVVSSRQVAEHFGKEHKHVLENIREIIKAENSALTYFYESTYKAGTGKSYPEYIMNRDGFTLLAMGFTGKEALQWKMKYIAAFNEMEQTLAQPVQPTDLQRQRLAIMERNSKSREASLWLKIAAGSSVPSYKDVANAYAANILAGREVLPLPEASEQTYSATDIGRMLGVSAMKIGQLANKHGLKVAQYGRLFYDKSRYSNKQVETFRYYHCAVDRFRTLLGGEA